MQQSEIIVNYLADKYDNEPEKKRVKFSSLHWKTNSNVHDTRFSKIGFEYKIYLQCICKLSQTNTQMNLRRSGSSLISFDKL